MKRTKADDVAAEQGYYYDPVQAEKPVKFAERFFRSQFIAGKLTLLPWQADFLRYVYGWRKPNGNRRFRLVTLHVPKKNGKTTLVSIIAFYELLASGEPSPYVVSCAPSQMNASQVFEELAFSLERSPFAKFAKATPHLKQLRIKQNNARFRSLASDGKKQHGWHCSCAIVDEGTWLKSDMWSAVKQSGRARPNHLCVVISTTGEDQTNWYYAVYQKAKRVIAGEDVSDLAHAAFVYEHAPDKPLDDEGEWLRSNPSIPVAFPLEQFRDEFVQARETGVGDFLDFQRLSLNRWVKRSEAAAFDVTNYEEFGPPKKDEPDENLLRRCPAFCGADLSEAGDPSSVSIIWHLGEQRYHVRSWAWVCEDGVKNRERATNSRRYDEWLVEGSLTVTQGGMIDPHKVRSYILNLFQTYDVRKCFFDPRGAYMMMNDFREEGYDTERIPQTYRYYTPLINEFNRAYREGRITHNGSEWLKFCISNVRIEVDRNLEIRPDRASSSDHVDGAIATLLAFHGHIAEQEGQANAFLL